ncbi:MAG TPA: signal recognition particle-docking protein FtsY [Candidatus Nitrosotalea sp.]|nr:signal recognition particle-docking protein FtsY [Candidatus Nitrosotalea sp.]
MFDKLRNAFSSAVKSLGEKELKEKDIDEVLFELEIALLESDVATEVIDMIKEDLKKQLVGTSVPKDKIDDFVKQSLRKSISSMFDATPKIDIISSIQKKKEKGEPYIISFMGINGTGKTTTVAKFANLLRENKLTSVIAAADTYRAGAVEQISEHGKRLNIKVIAQNYGSDPAAVSRDAVLYAKSHKVDCVLIDTAGRMQTSKNLMDQISKINKVVNPDLKLFVGDSLAGNDTVSQAREFHNYTKFDGAILTKSDADARGGAAISIVKITSTPILYLGVGQEYKDLKPFDKESFLESLFGAQEPMPEIRVQQREAPQQREVPAKVEASAAKPEPKAEPRPELKLEVKAEPRPEPKVEAKPEIKPEPKVEIKPEPKVEPEPKPEPKPEIKPQPRPEPKVETRPEPKPAAKAEVKPEQKPRPEEADSEDPFAGIATKDIEKYSDLYDVPPPETDDEARKLASKLRKWISEGRPKPSEEKEEVIEEEPGEEKVSDDEKPKKKRSMFGWMKK